MAPFTVEPIAVIRSCYSEKFGVPRQPRLVTAARAVLEFYPQYGRPEMLNQLEKFTHIWIIFLFHETFAEGWKSTARPPRLGGQKRVGVYASRSPHRPNHIGMSAVRLEKVVTGDGPVRLELSGIDLLEGTPVLDIKPYVPYSDIVEEAGCGYTFEPIPQIPLQIGPQVEEFCKRYQADTGRNLRELIVQTLQYDPRPASQRTVVREFGVLLWDVNVRWRATAAGFVVLTCEKAG